MIDLKKIEWLAEMIEDEIKKQFPGVDYHLTLDVFAKRDNDMIADLEYLDFEEGRRGKTAWLSKKGENKHVTVFLEGL